MLDALNSLLASGFLAECQKNKAGRWVVEFWANAADLNNTPILIAYGEATQFMRALELANSNIRLGGEASRFYIIAHDACTIYPKEDSLYFLDFYTAFAKKARICMVGSMVHLEIILFGEPDINHMASGLTLYEAMFVLGQVLKEEYSGQAMPG